MKKKLLITATMCFVMMSAHLPSVASLTLTTGLIIDANNTSVGTNKLIIQREIKPIKTGIGSIYIGLSPKIMGRIASATSSCVLRHVNVCLSPHIGLSYATGLVIR